MNKDELYKPVKRPRWISPWASLFAVVLFLILVILSDVSAQQSSERQKLILNLSLEDTISRALKNNVMVKLARERIEETSGLRTQSKADLLPHLSVGAKEERVFWENLASQGLPESGVLGPFNSFDARAQLTQRVFDLSAFSGFRAEDIALKISRLEQDFVTKQVIISAVSAYLNVLKNEEELKAVEEDIRLAERLVATAEHQLSAGIVTELDVVRARTRLARHKADRQDVIENFYSNRFRLMRVIGAPLEADVRLTDSMRYFKEEVLPVNEAVNTAFDQRVEMSMSEERVRYRERKLSEAKSGRLPTIDVYGNYGQAGVTPDKDSHEVASVGVKMTVTPFEGGEIEGRIRENLSKKKAEELKQNDLRVQIEEDVRLALQILITGTDKVRVAQEALDLAKREVELAQKQYQAGLEDNIAVIQAQDVLARAQETAISSLTQYHLARINYFSALGRTEEFHLNPTEDKGERQ